MGFVGLTLAVALASKGHYVTGIDIRKELINSLKKKKPHILEPRLPEMMEQVMKTGNLYFDTEPPIQHHRVFILAVGTPINDKSKPNLESLFMVAKNIAERLCVGDLVMLRSTVPVGTTSKYIKKILEEDSGLLAGKDFALAFTPERTVEGNAINELRSLPQIVGGYTIKCREKAASFWNTLTDTVVLCETLEEAELIKLINNSFRDHVFAFANGVALLTDMFNLDANRVIAAANEGYPRNRIPCPSPGVGGYCLTKDPLLYAAYDDKSLYSKMSVIARQVNDEAAQYPVKVIKKYIEREKIGFEQIKVGIIGLAFKGNPETNDIRFSTSIKVAETINELGIEVNGFDAVLTKKEIEDANIKYLPIFELAEKMQHHIDTK